MELAGPTPEPTPDTLRYWQNCARHQLQIQRCRTCGNHYFYPRPFCPACFSEDVEWTDAAGSATLVSYVINHRPLPPFDPKTPLVIAVVELAEGPRMMTNIVGVAPEPENLPLDMPLRVAFVDRGEYAVPVFEPVGRSSQ
jgi:uncharacterized OB-fold protein